LGECSFSKKTELRIRFIVVTTLLVFFNLLPCEFSLGCGSYNQEVSQTKKIEAEPLSEYSKQWLEEVVPYIITGAEIEIFKNLPTEEDRGKFIENFWEKRDPDKNTPENEFKLDYYRRIAYANKFFGEGGIAGWRTERGRIFILLGPPNEISRDMNPRASRFQTAYHGKTEIWNYWGLPNSRLPYNMEFVFVDKFAMGNFVLEQSLQMAEEGTQNFNLDESHYVFDYLEYLTEATRNPFEELDKLRGIVTTQVTYDHIPIEYESFSLRGTDETTFIPMLLRVPLSALEPEDVETEKHFSLTAMVIVSNEAGAIIFEKSKDFDIQHISLELDELEESMHQMQISLTLEPDAHKIHILLLDNNSGMVGTVHKEFQVRDFRGEDLAMSDIILTSSRPFEVKNPTPSRKTISEEITHTFRVGDEMNIFSEVYNLSVNSETESSDFTVVYEILQDGNSLARIPGPPGIGRKDREAQIITSFKLKNFERGDYTLKVKVGDRNSGKNIEGDAEFTIIR
jgi:GWxTD domain-containing protein